MLRTGLGIVPLTVPIILGARHAGRVSGRIGLDATIALAFAFVGCGLLGLSTSGTQTSYIAYAAWLVVTGTGVALALPTLSGAIAGALPPEQAGVGAGLQATTREFGSALGVAVIGTVLTARFAAALPPDIRARPFSAHRGRSPRLDCPRSRHRSDNGVRLGRGRRTPRDRRDRSRPRRAGGAAVCAVPAEGARRRLISGRYRHIGCGSPTTIEQLSPK
ncbi:hypothetical protein ABZW96_29555 [Nocardia sp. NPDC004168]|uniref:hypothetical protein n=1 Tax=Nocardia sp. NPDC004168 TaxID=3154452 RepID=UPI0033A1C8DC